MNLWRRMTEQNPNLSKGSCMSRTYVSRWEFARFTPHGCADMGIWMCTHAHTYFTHMPPSFLVLWVCCTATCKSKVMKLIDWETLFFLADIQICRTLSDKLIKKLWHMVYDQYRPPSSFTHAFILNGYLSSRTQTYPSSHCMRGWLHFKQVTSSGLINLAVAVS